MIIEVLLNNNNPDNKPLSCQPGSVITLQMDNGKVFRIDESDFIENAFQITELNAHKDAISVIPKTSNSILIK